MCETCSKLTITSNSGKFSQHKGLLGAVIFASRFRSYGMHVVTSILKKTFLISFQVFSSKISSKVGHFRASRNERFSSTPAMVGSGIDTTQNIKVYTKGFFSNCDQIRSFLWIWSHLLRKSLMENFIFCAVQAVWTIFTSLNLVITLRLAPE